MRKVRNGSGRYCAALSVDKESSLGAVMHREIKGGNARLSPFWAEAFFIDRIKTQKTNNADGCDAVLPHAKRRTVMNKTQQMPSQEIKKAYSPAEVEEKIYRRWK